MLQNTYKILSRSRKRYIVKLLNRPAPISSMLQSLRPNYPIRKISQEREIINDAGAWCSASCCDLVRITGKLDVWIIVSSQGYTESDAENDCRRKSTVSFQSTVSNRAVGVLIYLLKYCSHSAGFCVMLDTAWRASCSWSCWYGIMFVFVKAFCINVLCAFHLAPHGRNVRVKPHPILYIYISLGPYWANGSH